MKLSRHRDKLRALACAALVVFGADAAAAAQGEATPQRFDYKFRWADVEVEFEGNRAFRSESLLRVLRQSLEGRGDAARSHDEELFAYDKLEYWLKVSVVGFMRRSGYLRAKVGGLEMRAAGPKLKVNVPVEEGEFYRLGEVRIEGAEYASAKSLRKMLPLKKGEPADGVAVQRWLGEHVKKLYDDGGFIQYEYDVEPEFKLAEGEAGGVVDLLISINEGRRFILRGIEFKGLGRTPEEVLRAALLVREGEPFSAQKFKDSVAELNRLGLFEEDIDAEQDSEFFTDEERADLSVVVRVREKP